MEFAFGGDPTDPSDDHRIQPSATIASDEEDVKLQFKFRRMRATDSNGLQYTLTSSENLAQDSWNSYKGELSIEPLNSEPDFEMVTAAINLPERGRRFVRLQVEAPNQYNRTFYIEDQADFDALTGTSFEAGDRILFKRGATFHGMFEASGEGTAAAPIRVGAYGEETALPIIDAQGENEAALLLRNISFWEIDGLELTNPYKNNAYVTDGHTIMAEKKLFGLLVRLDGEEKVYEHIYIENCYVRDVNDMVGEKEHGGIHVRMYDLTDSHVENLRIVGNRVERVGGVGIANQSTGAGLFDNFVFSPRNLWKGVYVADNVVDTTGRNNVIARVSEDAIYERNVLANSSRADTGHNIFPFNTIGVKIQYNEAYGNIGNGGDRGGFDADYNCVNTYIQYNYSHDNEWFLGIMKRKQENVTVRYNVSVNERAYYFGFNNADYNLSPDRWDRLASDVKVYNNTHYISDAFQNFEVFDGASEPFQTTFQNNIYYFAGSGRYGDDDTERVGQASTFDNNVYVNLSAHVLDSNPQTIAPQLVGPLQESPVLIDLETMSGLEGYRLARNSPYLSGGNVIPGGNGGQNILKEPIDPDTPHYGAF